MLELEKALIGGSGLALERLAFVVRRRVERETRERGVDVYFPSLSARTLVYKGMLTTDQLPAFFPDLSDPRLVSAITLVHRSPSSRMWRAPIRGSRM